MVHKPKHKVHSFRGLLADGGQDEIHLERQNLNMAYRIIKFDLMPGEPGGDQNDSVVQIWKQEQSSVTASANFTLTDLLACGIYSQHSTQYNMNSIVVFDNVLFSRNIFVTHKDESAGQTCNYYIEIEEVPVTASTLMQIKLGTARTLISGSMGK